MERYEVRTTVAAVIAEYDRLIRVNATPEWDTILAVATCEDGIYGALGEVWDTANAMGIRDAAFDAIEDDLQDAFEVYQQRLRDEVLNRAVTR